MKIGEKFKDLFGEVYEQCWVIQEHFSESILQIIP